MIEIYILGMIIGILITSIAMFSKSTMWMIINAGLTGGAGVYILDNYITC